MAGNLAVVKLLIKYGGDPKVKAKNGKNAIELAQCLGWDEIAAYLSNV